MGVYHGNNSVPECLTESRPARDEYIVKGEVTHSCPYKRRTTTPVIPYYLTSSIQLLQSDWRCLKEW